MSLQRALGDLEMYSSMTILPFEGVKGLSLYLRRKESARELMLRNLKYGKEFCDVAKKIFTEPPKAISENVFIYKGMQEVYKDENIRREIVEKIVSVGNTIDSILKGDESDPKKVKECIDILEKVSEDAEKSLSYLKVLCENYIIGKPVFA